MLLFRPFLAYSNKHNSLHLSILHVLQISAIFLDQNEFDHNLGCKFYTDLTAMHSETISYNAAIYFDQNEEFY